MNVVVHHGLGQPLYEAGLYLEALRRRDVLEVDAAEGRRDSHHRFDEGVHVPSIDQYGHRGDAGELVVEDGLAFHHRHRGHGPDVSQTQDARPVSADGNATTDHGQLARQRGVLDDGLARPRHPRGVHVAHVLHRPDRVGGLDYELPALVFEERSVARPQDLDAVQFAQHPDDPLGPLAVLNFQGDLAHRGLPADVDRRHVPDQATTLSYRPGDLGQLARAVRELYTVGVIERHGEPPNVPGRPSPSSSCYRGVITPHPVFIKGPCTEDPRYRTTAIASISMRSRGSMSAETSTIEEAGKGSSK